MANSISLEQIFGAIVNQDTLEVAAEEMASLSRSYPELTAEFTRVLEAAIRSALAGDPSVVMAVNRSGYRVTSCQEVEQYCSELLALYSTAAARPA